MARTLTGTIKAALGLTYLGDLDLGSQKALLPFAAEISIGNGTGNGQANLAWWDNRSIAGSSSEDLDLAGGLTDAFGQALTFTKVKGIYVKAAAANVGNIVIGGKPSTGFFAGLFGDITDKIKVAPGQSFLITNMNAGWTVTAATADILLMANDAAGTALYDIAIIGLS